MTFCKCYGLYNGIVSGIFFLRIISNTITLDVFTLYVLVTSTFNLNHNLRPRYVPTFLKKAIKLESN